MSQAGIYSELKPAFWLMRDGGLPDAPKQVQVILSDLCNQDCNFCAYRMTGYTSNELFVGSSPLAKSGHNNPVRYMDAERALRLVEEIRAAGCLAIQFTGGGEPTVHPRHEDIFERTLGLGLRASLVSNGFRWRERIFDLLPRFDWVRVSIDAGTEDTYSAIRHVPIGSLGKVLANVYRLCKGLGSGPTVVGMGYVVTPENWQEIPAGIALARDTGAHNMRLSAMFSPEDERPFADIHGKIRDLIADARSRYESPTFRVYDNFGSRLDDLVERSPDYPLCGYQYYTTYIGGDMKAYRCCVLSYNRRGLIKGGDLTNRRFDEYWASEDRKKDFGSFDARGCPRCQFNSKNRVISYVVGSTEADLVARHLEFP